MWLSCYHIGQNRFRCSINTATFLGKTFYLWQKELCFFRRNDKYWPSQSYFSALCPSLMHHTLFHPFQVWESSDFPSGSQAAISMLHGGEPFLWNTEDQAALGPFQAFRRRASSVHTVTSLNSLQKWDILTAIASDDCHFATFLSSPMLLLYME